VADHDLARVRASDFFQKGLFGIWDRLYHPVVCENSADGLRGLAVIELEHAADRSRQRTGPGRSDVVFGAMSSLPKPWCGRSS
jgi:hypothetical protein